MLASLRNIRSLKMSKSITDRTEEYVATPLTDNAKLHICCVTHHQDARVVLS
jgi:hypothetical protein